MERFTPEYYRRPLIPGLVTLVNSRNPGIAFGLFADHDSKWLATLLIVVTFGVIALLGWLLATGRAGGRLSETGLALILGGALGNLVDRVLFGRVTDFIELQLGRFRWPAFNLADSAITIGAVLIAWELLRPHRAPGGERG